MKNHEFEAFYQVMLTGSITEAARNMGRTQPAVSMTIKTLEGQLGFSLFERTATGLKPRVEAKVMFERLRPVMEQLHDIERSLVQLAPGVMPQMSIIAANNVGTYLVPSRIAPLAAEGQSIRVMNGSASRILSAMEAQQHDIAIMDEGLGSTPPDSPLYESERFEVPMYALFPRGLIETSRDTVGPEDLRPHRICAIYYEHKLGPRLSELYGRPQMEFQNFYPMACYALHSGSVALVDYITCTTVSALNAGNPEVDWRRLDVDQPSVYHLLRPRFRPRSERIDHCHAVLRAAMLEHSQMAPGER
ncbi:LysR family transcriptional regulator [Rhodobium gokarnense]|uniref:DNA-binding transcriptional LysR family regulator n=1 Tax=Rhodobium gokarnense TaxID=364296 RepID=A0ABT3HF14_9HYPH|nr:LysR family transcriptional regulator [Rhodobium gokarnense]MCW2308982.1 DNA-binding transcriptional LysR family regulator [Rhodobium gokarnense]